MLARTSSSTGYFSDWRRGAVAVPRDLQGAIDLAARVLDDLGAKEPPVPSSFIHFIDPVRLVHVALEPLSRLTRGATLLAPDGAEWRVVLNANDRVEVRRFTLAREASHIACGTGAGLPSRRDGAVLRVFAGRPLRQPFAHSAGVARGGRPSGRGGNCPAMRGESNGGSHGSRAAEPG